MRRIFNYKDKEVEVTVILNATSKQKEVNTIDHDTRTITVPLHKVTANLVGNAYNSMMPVVVCEDYELEKTITDVEKKAKMWIDNLEPRVDPTAEKLKKIGFV